MWGCHSNLGVLNGPAHLWFCSVCDRGVTSPGPHCTHLLIKSQVHELLNPLLHIWPAAVPDVPLVPAHFAQELLRFGGGDGHRSSWQRTASWVETRAAAWESPDALRFKSRKVTFSFNNNSKSKCYRLFSLGCGAGCWRRTHLVGGGRQRRLVRLQRPSRTASASLLPSPPKHTCSS